MPQESTAYNVFAHGLSQSPLLYAALIPSALDHLLPGKTKKYQEPLPTWTPAKKPPEHSSALTRANPLVFQGKKYSSALLYFP